VQLWCCWSRTHRLKELPHLVKGYGKVIPPEDDADWPPGILSRLRTKEDHVFQINLKVAWQSLQKNRMATVHDYQHQGQTNQQCKTNWAVDSLCQTSNLCYQQAWGWMLPYAARARIRSSPLFGVGALRLPKLLWRGHGQPPPNISQPCTIFWDLLRSFEDLWGIEVYYLWLVLVVKDLHQTALLPVNLLTVQICSNESYVQACSSCSRWISMNILVSLGRFQVRDVTPIL
jgi:hypothetical protein